MSLSQQRLVKELVKLVDQCESFSVFAGRTADELEKIRRLRGLLRQQKEDLQKEYVRYNLGQRRVRLLEDWLNGEKKLTRTIAMLNMKGGVGKTTLTYNLAWYAAYMKNFKVLAVDLDPQANLSQLLLGDAGYEQYLEKGLPSIVDIFESSVPQSNGLIRRAEQWQDGSRIHLVPSKLELSTTFLRNPATKERRLSRFLSGVKEEYDIVLIDCPPTESILTLAAYLAADYVLVPVRLERLATIGLPLLSRSLSEFNGEYAGEHDVAVAGIVYNDVDQNESPENRKSRQSVRAMADKYGWKVFESEVRNSRSYPTGTRAGTPIFLTPRARDYVKGEFYVVGDEFLESVGLS